MDAKIQKMRERLKKQREKVSELEAQAAETEKEIKKAEEEQLGYLARSAANTLSGGMEDVFKFLRSLRVKPNDAEPPGVSATPNSNIANIIIPGETKKSDENKEGETIYEFDEMGETEQKKV